MRIRLSCEAASALPALAIFIALAVALPRATCSAGAKPAEPPAVLRLAAICDAEVAEWSRQIELTAGSPSRLTHERKVEEIVILYALAASLDEAADPKTRAELERRSEIAAEALSLRRLEQRLRLLEQPSEAELHRAFEIRSESLRHPRLWRLADIFKAAPANLSATERAEVRQRMEALRARIVAGEEFAEIARAESESSTRERGGASGFVALDDLRPELARVVADLDAGDLSPVIELPGGFVLLQSGGIDPEREAKFDDERAGIQEALRNERVLARRKQIEAEIDAGLATQAAARGSEAPTRSRRLDDEARRLGWSPDEDDRILTHWKRLEVRAQFAADLAVARRAVPPTAPEIAAAFAAAPGGWIEPRKRHLRVLTLDIDRSREAAFYERFLATGRALAALPASSSGAAGTLEQAQASVAPLGRLEDLGWLTDDEIWALGRNAELAIRALTPGRLSAAVQEGRRLQIFELSAERPARPKALGEAAPQIEQALLARRRREAIEELRREILASAAAKSAAAPGAACEPEPTGGARP